MKLASDWKHVIRRAWSIRLLVIAGLLSGLEVALPFLDGLLPIPPGVFAGLSAIATGGAFVARLIAQQGFDDEQA